MPTKNVNVFDVLRNFYATDHLLAKAYSKLRRHEVKITHKKLELTLKKIKKKAQKVRKYDLATQDLKGYHIRYDNYVNSDWKIENVNLRDCGVWPKMGGLPHQATQGDLVDTVNYIKPYLKDKSKLTYETSVVLYLEEIMKYAELITKYFPIIVLKDGVNRQLKLRKVKFRKKYKNCKYDIDDGCHRAVAYALLGKKQITAYVGKRRYKSPILY